MKRLVCPLAVLTLLLVGCTEDIAGPAPGTTTADAHGGLHPINFHTSCSSPDTAPFPYQLTIGGQLDPGGDAHGQVSLQDRDDPRRRYHYLLEEGEVRCEDGAAVVRLSGTGFMTPNQEQQDDRLFRHDYSFSVPASVDEGGGRTPFVVVATLVAGEPADLVGEAVRLECDRAFSPANACATR